jgi:(p)ppGpp synthase/HD superfamily hydrolase
MLSRAILLATTAHKGQYRNHVGKSGTKIPYVFHCVEVTKTLWDWGVDDEDLLTAAVLHDVVEDTSISAGEIEFEFNRKVARVVDELTFIPTTDEPKQRAAEKAIYMESFSKKSIEALVAKLADRFCNTLDKLRSENNRKSAKKYFHKADALFKAWWDRMDELVARFGQQVQDNIEEQHHSVLVALE